MTDAASKPSFNRAGWQKRFRRRLPLALVGFSVLFVATGLRLIDVTIVNPHPPDKAAIAALKPDFTTQLRMPDRASILDRNGRLLAVSLPGAALYADPREIRHPQRDARMLRRVLPSINPDHTARLLGLHQYGFVYIDRRLTAQQELAVNRLGLPGLYFQKIWERHYPKGDLAAHILGGVTPGQRGISGVEAYFDKGLRAHPGRPLRLSIDIRVQAIVHRELARAMHDYHARAACGIVESMTGRLLAMVSLPGFDANDFHDAPRDARLDRCISGDYEPGSVMKLMTLPAALQSGMMHYWDRFNTTHPISADGFTITDYEPVHRWLAMPSILAYSSNIGASRIATILGPKLQRAWLRKMGFFRKPAVEMPGAQPPIWHSKGTWKLLTTMTVSFGNGIAMPPLTMVNAVVADVNGGVLFRPTLLAAAPGAPPRTGIRVMRPGVSRTMCRLMRDVVLSGTGVYARVAGYRVGGKTGTAQVVGKNGRYRAHLNNSSFMAVFPTDRPRYVVYVLVVHPRPTKKMRKFSHGFTTGGYVAAPAVGRIISRIGPMLGVRPVEGPALEALDRSFRIPLSPRPPAGRAALGHGHPFPPGANRYAYILAHETPPKHPDRNAIRAALRRIELAVPGVSLEPEGKGENRVARVGGSAHA